MAAFTPYLIKETVGHMEFLTPGKEYPAGSTFGQARIAENDGKDVSICYEWGEVNCAACSILNCPFNSNPSAKERR